MKAEKKRILVVEDDPAIARGLRDLLLSESYSVRLCNDGESGLTQALATSPDLVLLDINLPKLNGLAVLRQLQENGFAKPIIMLTCSDAEADKVTALYSGAVGYVTKPFSNRELLAEIYSITKHLSSLSKPPEPPKAAERKGEERERKLLAIMFTDMHEYSRMMNVNENLTMDLLELHRKMVGRIVSNHRGTVVEAPGDAFVVSFESVTAAVQCAVAIQRDFKAYRGTRSKSEHIHIRIGIHVGDVVLFQGGLKGDAMNIAQRVQQLAEPDSVYISENVFDNIKNKLNHKVIDLGSRHVKHISKPIKVYRVNI